MLQQPKIHPLLAFQHCGLFVDAESAYTMSMEFYEEQQQKMLEQQKAQSGGEDDGDEDGDMETS